MSVELTFSLIGLLAIAYFGRRIARKTEAGPPRPVSAPSGPVSLPNGSGWTRPHP